MSKMRFGAHVVRVFEPGPEQLSAAAAIDKRKPRFCVSMMLARLDIQNGNGHRIKLDHAKKAVAAQGDHPNIPGNLDHTTAAYGTSTRLWIKEEDDLTYPELWLEAVYWNRYISDEKYAEIMASYENGTLGASWEIDRPFELAPDPEYPHILDVSEFEFSGFGLMVGKPPAESRTRGTASITASLDDDIGFWDYEPEEIEASEADKEAQKKRSQKYGIGVKDKGNVTKPGKYANVSDAKFGDPVNYKYPVDDAHVGPAVQYFNHEGQRDAGGYTSAEWAKIGRRIAKAAGKGYKYANGKIVTPTTEAGMSAEDVVRVSSYGDLPTDLLTSIMCPACGERGRIKKLDFETGKFEMECLNGEYDADKPTHRYEITINVKQVGAAQAYLVAAKDGAELGDDIDTIAYQLIPHKEVDKLAKEYTDEEIETIKADARAQALVEKETAEKALAEQKEQMEAEVERRVKEDREKFQKEEREKIAAEYKAVQEKLAARLKETEETMAVSDEERDGLAEKLSAMSDEEFAQFIAMRKKDKEIADLKAGKDDKKDLPGGDLKAGADDSFDWAEVKKIFARV